MKTHFARTKQVRLLSVAMAVVFVAAGCSSSNSSEDASADDGSTSSDPVVAEAVKAVADMKSGAKSEPPSEGPAAQPGDNIWMISCGEVLTGCAAVAAGVDAAAKELGWKLTIADGKGTPAGQLDALRQAVAAKADGIVVTGVDCSSAKPGYEAAKAAGIPTVAVYSVDCDDPSVGGEALITKLVPVAGDTDWRQLFQTWGTAKANYAIAATNGKAKIVQFTLDESLITKDESGAFAERVKECKSCDIVATKNITFADLTAGTANQVVATTMLQNPDATFIELPNDSIAETVSQALRNLNMPDIKVSAGEGYAGAMGLIEDGYVTAAVTLPSDWFGWAGADVLNRLLADETEIPDQGAGVGIVDKTNLPPKGSAYVPPIDYKAAYTAMWSGK